MYKNKDQIYILEDQLRNKAVSVTSSAEILNELGFEYYKQTQYKKAIEKHMQVLKILPRQEQNQRLIAFRFIGENYRMLKKFKKGLQYCNQHLEMSEQVQNDLETQRAFCNLGLLYMGQAESFLEKNRYTSEEFERTINLSIDNLLKNSKLIQKIIANIKSSGSQLGGGVNDSIQKNKYSQISNFKDVSLIQMQVSYAESIYNQANALSIKGQWDSKYYEPSIDVLQQALKEAKEIKYTILEGKCYNTMGLIYLNQKKYELSSKQFIKDAEICNKGGDITGLIQTYINIGITQQYMRQYKRAEEYFQKALNLSKQHKLSDQISKTEEKIDNLNLEINLRDDNKRLEVQIKKQNKFNEKLYKEYCVQLQDLEEFQALLDFTTNALLTNQNNLSMLLFKAIAEEKLIKYNESKETYQKILTLQQRGGQQTAEYAYNLIDYANILDELKEQVEIVESKYWEAHKIAVDLEDAYIQKIILENLDIIYEQKKLSKKRKETKRMYNALLANHPELKQSSASKDSESSSSDSDSYMSAEDDVESQVSFKVQTNRNTNQVKNKSNDQVNKQKDNRKEKQKIFDMNEDEDLDFTFRTDKKNKNKKINDEENEYSSDDSSNKKSYDHPEKNFLKANKNFIKEKSAAANTPIQQYSASKQNNQKGNNPYTKIPNIFSSYQKYIILFNVSIQFNISKYFQSEFEFLQLKRKNFKRVS